MKKRLSFVSTIVIGLTAVVLIGAIVIWCKEEFSLPDWIIALASIVAVYLFIEIICRLGPQEFEPPSIKYMKLSIKDRIVFAVAIFVLFVLALPVGARFNSVTIRFLFGGLGFLVYWLILFFFGSKELLHSTGKN